MTGESEWCSSRHPVTQKHTHTDIYDLVPQGVHDNRTYGGEHKVDDTLKLSVLLQCAQC